MRSPRVTRVVRRRNDKLGRRGPQTARPKAVHRSFSRAKGARLQDDKSKSPLLAQRTREKWGTRHEVPHEPRPKQIPPCARLALLGSCGVGMTSWAEGRRQHGRQEYTGPSVAQRARAFRMTSQNLHPYDFALSKIPLLAQRTREKWGTRHEVPHEPRPKQVPPCARLALLGSCGVGMTSWEGGNRQHGRQECTGPSVAQKARAFRMTNQNPHFSRKGRARNGAPGEW